MSGWGVSLTGYSRAVSLLEGLEMNLSGDTMFIVGPSVEYAIYVDRGTSKMEARPFVEPAARRVQSNVNSHVSDFIDGSLFNASEEAIVRAAALAVQLEMVRIITRKGAVDTGAMRDSVSIEKVKG